MKSVYRFFLIYYHLPTVKCDNTDFRGPHGDLELKATSGDKFLYLLYDMVHDTDRDVRVLKPIMVEAQKAPAYEVGFLYFMLQNRYRKIVDRYQTIQKLGRRLHLSEMVLYLAEIEQLYWDISHISGMLHEVERKYNIELPPGAPYLDPLTADITIPTSLRPKRKRTQKPKGEKKRHKVENRINDFLSSKSSTITPNSTRWWWPLEYGWEIDTLFDGHF